MVKWVYPKVFALAVFLFFSSFVLSTIRSAYRQPQLIPINRTDGEYRISNQFDYYMVKYKGPLAWNVGIDANGYTTVIVGRTKYDLSQYLNKKVRITDGNFVARSQQCIAGRCKNTSGPHVVIDINDLEVLE